MIRLGWVGWVRVNLKEVRTRLGWVTHTHTLVIRTAIILSD